MRDVSRSIPLGAFDAERMRSMQIDARSKNLRRHVSENPEGMLDDNCNNASTAMREGARLDTCAPCSAVRVGHAAAC